MSTLARAALCALMLSPALAAAETPAAPADQAATPEPAKPAAPAAPSAPAPAPSDAQASKPVGEAGALAKDEILAILFYNLRRPISVARLRSSLRRRFDTANVDGGAITESDLKRRAARGAASDRGARMARWLGYDLNGDGVVDRAELEDVLRPQAMRPIRMAGVEISPTKEQVQTILDNLVKRTRLPDPNGDGVSTLDEMYEAARNQVATQPRRRVRVDAFDRSPLDLDGDGATEWVEVDAAFVAAVELIDTNRDDMIDQGEIGAANRRVRTAFNAQRQRLNRLRIELERERRSAQ